MNGRGIRCGVHMPAPQNKIEARLQALEQCDFHKLDLWASDRHVSPRHLAQSRGRCLHLERYLAKQRLDLHSSTRAMLA